MIHPFIASLLLYSAVTAASLFASLDIPLSNQAKSELIKLQATSNHSLHIQWNEQTGTPRRILGTLSERSNHTPEWISLRWIAKYRSLYGSRFPNTEYVVRSSVRQSDHTLVRLQQTVFSTPVLGNELEIEITLDGVIRRVEGSLFPEVENTLFHHPLTASITENEAITIAKRLMNGSGSQNPEVQRYFMPSSTETPIVYVVTWPAKQIIIHGHTGMPIQK
jgi:Zn-dependent metalloprotease